MAFLELRDVAKSFGEGPGRNEVLHGLNVSVEEGEFLAIVGFSGSGKTTLINLLAGLNFPDSGEILLRGRPVRGPGPDRGLIFQNYSLLPWLTVLGNVRMAVDAVFSQWSDAKRQGHALRYIEMVGLSDAVHKRPAELSGGMRQRVAVARALAMNPAVLLMDEPLGALDALTRGTLQEEIERIWSRDKKTVVLITNDVDEGILLADRVIPLTPAPRATLGTHFSVDLPRPRERAALNRDPGFIAIRNRVIRTLGEMQSRHRLRAQIEALTLPDLKPVEEL